MAVMAMPRPDLAAHRESLLLPRTIVSRLATILGRKLTAYIGKVKDVRAIDRWMAGGDLRRRGAAPAFCLPGGPYASGAGYPRSGPGMDDRGQSRTRRPRSLAADTRRRSRHRRGEVLRAARAFLAGGQRIAQPTPLADCPRAAFSDKAFFLWL